MKYKSVAYVPELSDPGVVSLWTLSCTIAKLMEKYGSDALVQFDAGHNNISCDVVEPVNLPKPVIVVNPTPGGACYKAYLKSDPGKAYWHPTSKGAAVGLCKMFQIKGAKVQYLRKTSKVTGE